MEDRHPRTQGKPLLASDADSYKDTVTLYERVLDIVPAIPKAYRYNVGSRMVELCLDMLHHYQRAFLEKEDRLHHIRRFLSCLEVLKTLLRTASERHWISVKTQARTVELTVSIGRQVVAWKSRNEGRTPAAAAGVPSSTEAGSEQLPN